MAAGVEEITWSEGKDKLVVVGRFDPDKLVNKLCKHKFDAVIVSTNSKKKAGEVKAIEQEGKEERLPPRPPSPPLPPASPLWSVLYRLSTFGLFIFRSLGLPAAPLPLGRPPPRGAGALQEEPIGSAQEKGNMQQEARMCKSSSSGVEDDDDEDDDDDDKDEDDDDDDEDANAHVFINKFNALFGH